MFRSVALIVSCALLSVNAAAQDVTKPHLLSKAEATVRAKRFFDREIVVDGALGRPSLSGDSWAFPVTLGLGVMQRDPILVDRRSGRVSWAGLAAHKAMLKRLNPNISLNPDASPAALRAVRSAPVSFVR